MVEYAHGNASTKNCTQLCISWVARDLEQHKRGLQIFIGVAAFEL
ncbi:hypothetical protein CIPAW_08G090000 [Carya illinoinensis]|uniref:Uncharacterized protein n=1 Tax=Carya illinoinensis TaxID=32201 RepID=A0A8T1PVU3_CARIL|nr:hypothetical protein CIPAW_08G090000 [Carya illinoinensis]